MKGRYLYSIINSAQNIDFGYIGINDNRVYAVPFKDIAAVVHSCDAVVYQTKDNKKAEEWILSHNYVIDVTTKISGTVLPFSFDCIIKGNDDTIKDWLIRNYLIIKKEFERVKDKAEYSIQIFYDEAMFTERIGEQNLELKELKNKMESISKGTAYILKRRFEIKLGEVVLAEKSILARDFYEKIRVHTEEIKVENRVGKVSDRYKDKMQVAAFTCLVHDNNVEKLGEVLDLINKTEGFAIRFTGPWAPFSFVGLREAAN